MTEGSGIDALRRALAAAEARASEAEAKACEAEARAANEAARMSDAEAEIAFLKLAIEKLRRELHGWRSERKQRLLDQLELPLDELEASATEDELAAERAAEKTTEVKGFTRRRSGRKPFPAHLPRDRMHGDDTPVPVLASANALNSLRTARRCSADSPLIPRSMSNSRSIRFTASNASGEIGGAFLPRRLLAAMSASSKNFLLECAQHAASVTGPGDLPAT